MSFPLHTEALLVFFHLKSVHKRNNNDPGVCFLDDFSFSDELLPDATLNGATMDSGFELHQCLLAGMWNRMAPLACWPPSGQQVLNQKRHHQKYKTGLSVAPQKGLMSSKILEKCFTISDNN